MPVNNKRAINWSSDSDDSSTPPPKTLAVRKENIMTKKDKEKSVVMNGNGNVNVNGISPDASMNPVVVLSRDSVASALKRKSLGVRVEETTNYERNQDEEKRQRHRNRIATQRRSFHSPAQPITPGRKSLARPATQLNPEQLTQHYNLIFKLSASNKISVKNAFGLHMIDYIEGFGKDEKGRMNFKLASSALDAGTKIYCHRVDCVHAEAQKVASGLVMATDDHNGGGLSGEIDEESEINIEDEANALDEPKPKKKKTVKRRNTVTIAENPESLNVKKIESNIEIDPVFHHLNATYDVGNVCGLLMVNLKVNAESLLMLDPSATLEGTDQTTQMEESHAAEVSIDSFTNCLSDIVKTNSIICGKFANFEFLIRDGANDFMPTFEEAPNDDYYFNLEDEVEDIQDDVGGDGGEDDDDYGSDNEHDQMQPLHKSFARGMSMIAVNDLANLLSSKPNDYNYFNNKLIGTWAGPTHWKKVPWLGKGNRKIEGEMKKRQRKLYDEADFMSICEDENANAIGAGELKLKMPTLQKWHQNHSDLQLPQDHGFDPTQFGRSFSKPDEFFHCAKKDEDVHEASMEKDNSPPGSPMMDNYDYDDDDPHTAPFNDPLGTQSQNQQLPPPFMGDILVDKPDDLETFIPNYAKFAKKMNVKRLKNAMWNALAAPEPHNSPTTSMHQSMTDKMNTTIHFTELYQTLPRKITPQMATDLSVPIAFVTLLHLCNEKGLQLIGQEDLTNFDIEQYSE